eukprot:40231-Chlamydomonas_euryale.AAC.1
MHTYFTPIWCAFALGQSPCNHGSALPGALRPAELDPYTLNPGRLAHACAEPHDPGLDRSSCLVALGSLTLQPVP